MRLSPHQIPAMPLCALLVAALGCQSAQKSTFMPPAQAQAPAIASSATHDTGKQKPVPATVASSESPAKTPATKALAVDLVADLIAQAEKQFRAGQDSFRAERFEEAKRDFDSALNLLLASEIDPKSDDRLQAELTRIRDANNNLEMAVALAHDPLVEQKSEPAPIDAVNEVTPPVDLNVKAKAEAEIKSTHSDLPLMMTDQVAGYINYFSTRGRGVLERGLARSGRYEDMIRRILQEEGVPQDLIYLAQAESGFHPLAVSRAGARGMWQFMGSRAKGYGLQRSSSVDERQDPEKATRAAAEHLRDLYHEFGDWYLAMAAYNSGPGTVQNAVKRTGYADFWELYRRNVLPKETRNYVPIIVAVTIMAKNPDQYGLDDVVKEKPVSFDSVAINYPIDLRLAAQCVDASTADLQDLNPSLVHLTTPKGSNFDLHLPAGSAEQFQSLVAAVPVDMRVWWRYHKVQEGETLYSIARAYRTSVKSIAEANGLDESAISPEMRLIVPLAPGRERDSTTYARAITRYRIRGGDTVESVAENFGVSPKMIRTWNRLKSDNLAGRKVLLVHLPLAPVAQQEQLAGKRSPSKRTTSARASIDQGAGAATGPQSSAKRASQQAGSQHAGPNIQQAKGQGSKAQSSKAQSLQAQAAPTQGPQMRADTQATAVVRHKVKPGETLYSIASSYNTTVSALKKENRSITNVAILRPGMILIIRDLR